jgi:hypothetical protein
MYVARLKNFSFKNAIKDSDEKESAVSLIRHALVES